MEWWVYRNGEVSDRPLTRRELREKEYVDSQTYVCRTGRDSWLQAGNDPELEGVFESEQGPSGAENLELDEGESSGPRAAPAFNVDHSSSSTSPPTESPSQASSETTGVSEASVQSEGTTEPETPELRTQRDVIATSLWKRPLAFAFDYGLFYLLFWLAGRYYYDRLVMLETTGIVVGYSLFLLYLAVFNSENGGSSSLGKKLLGLRVKNEEGFSISFFTALTRYFFLLIPFFLFSLAFTNIPGNVPDVVHVALIMVSMFVAVSLVYLYLFNAFRRSLHDCLTSTTVVEDPPRNHLNFRFWRPHLYFIGVFFALSIYGFSVLFMQYGGVVPILNLQKSLLDDPRILATEVPVYKNYTERLGKGPKTLYLTVWVKNPGEDLAALKRDILEVTFRQSTLIEHYGTIQLGIATGLDFGLYSRKNYHYDRRSLTAWKEYRQARMVTR